MESGQLRRLNLCYAGIQSLYWAGFAAIWAFLSVLLLYRGFSNSQIGTVSALALLMPLARSAAYDMAIRTRASRNMDRPTLNKRFMAGFLSDL